MTVPLPDAALRLAAIVECSDDAIFSKSLTGTITSWNAGAERLFGYQSSEAVGQFISMLLPPDRIEEEEVILARIRSGERISAFDTVRRRKDGTLINVSITISPILDAGGAVIGASSIARDASERQRTARALIESQGRLLALAQASASMAGSTDTETVLANTIETARQVFAADGYALWRVDDTGTWRAVRSHGISDRFASRAVAALDPAPPVTRVPFGGPLVCEDVSAVPALASLQEAYAQEGIVSLVVFPLRIGGELAGTFSFYFRQRTHLSDLDVQVGTAFANLAAAALSTTLLYERQQQARADAEGAARHARFLAQASEALSASLDYERTLTTVAELAVPTMADWCAVHIVDEHGKIQQLVVTHADPAKLQWARQLQERYPANPDAPGGIHEAMRTQRPTFMSEIPAALLEAGARDAEHLHIIRMLSLTGYICAPLVAYGRAFGAITFVSAESRRRYGDADVRMAQELAARAALAVENARAYARATEASRLKDDFLATLSHELRTPLNAVLGYARMLRLKSLGPDKIDHAHEIIERNAIALRQMIEDVLDVSRIVAGRVRLNLEALDLPRILQETCATVMPAASAKGVRIEAVIDPITTPIAGDTDRLQQIVWNLLSNAIKFTPRGGKVQLRLARVNSHVEITVSDTGRGIAPDFLPAVFERFRQENATFSREHGGLGLGLAIAKQLAELHGGTIHAASGGIGQGATFVVKLPLMIVHPVPHSEVREQPVTQRDAPTVAVLPRLDGLRVLAVDDEPDSLTLLQAILEGAGARVSTCHNAADALECLPALKPDVLIADIGMPGVDGHQLIQAVRELAEPCRSIPAAALTAFARSQDRIASLRSGFQLHLVKPIEPLELIVAVSRLAARDQE